MNIAVNTRLLIDDLHGGIEWFTYESLRRITAANPGHKFYFIFDRQYDEKFVFSSNVEPLVLGPRAVHPLLWHYWLQYRVKPLLKRIGADIFLSPDGMIPLGTGIPSIPVIHDINFMHRKEDLPFLQSLYFRQRFRKFALEASRVVTVSEFSKKDMIDTWGINPEKIDVVYNGVSEEYFPDNTANDLVPADPYFLFVGNLSPRKNVANLLRAFNIFRDKSGTKHKLIIAGERFFLNGETDREIGASKYKEDILLVGKKSRNELRMLYSRAEALVFVPWFEGFGIPVVEAMKCATPVITSSTTSLPEVGGDAAIYVDPGRPAEIASAMQKLLIMNGLRKDLLEKGRIQANKFSWDNTAAGLWETLIKSIKL